MPETEKRGPHLRTKFVFIDTQAFRRSRFDWNGRSLSKLIEFANHGQLRLLVTDVTIREVKSQLRELLSEAASSLNKHGGILQQLGALATTDGVGDQTVALGKLETAFDEFLKSAKAINVPLITDVKGLLDDYFARRPPFSEKKKAEFPDAISIGSVRHWCQENRSTVYIVSEDPDLRACCSEAGPLFHADSITEIISQATVSRELHQALESALRASEYLSERLVDEIAGGEVDIERSASRAGVESAKIEDIYSININSVNVLDQDKHTFTCELEVEVEVALEINVEIESHYGYGGYDDYYPSQRHTVHRTKTEYVYPEIIVRFDPSTGELEFESVSTSMQAVRVGIDDVERYLR